MNITLLSYRNMVDRPLSTLLSLLLLSLGVGIIGLLIQLDRHIEQQMQSNIRDIDMVVGAKGSPLQLILSAVYHIDAPTGNIDLHEAEQLVKNPLVDFGIPLSFGDSYRGYRIVGTDDSYPKLYGAEIDEGKLWSATLEVTIGTSVAQNLNLNVGDTFVGAHGLVEFGQPSNAEGIVAALGSPDLRLDLNRFEKQRLCFYVGADCSGYFGEIVEAACV